MSGGQSDDKAKSIGFVCGHCGQKLTVSVSRSGQRGQCPKCRRPVVVPVVAPVVVPLVEPLVKPAMKPEVAPPSAVTPPPVVRLGTEPDPRAVDKPVAAAVDQLIAESVDKPESEAAAPLATLEPPGAMPDWIQSGPRDESPWVFIDSPPETAATLTPPPVDSSLVSLPRYVLFAQGIALGVVAIVAFALGMLAGGSGRNSPGGTPSAAVPCVVSGTVEYVTSGGSKFPDEGAVVLLFPQDTLPGNDERAAVTGLRPHDPQAAAAAPGLQALRMQGAFHVRTDRAGQFRIPLVRGGKYYLLVVSHHGARRGGSEASRADLAALGRYVTAPDELLGDRRYRWRIENFQRDTELSVVLD